MSDLAAYLGAAVLVALAAWAFASERHGGRQPIRWAALGFALAQGCSLALLAPGTVALSHAGVDGLSLIALGDTVRTAAISFLMLMACLLNPRPARRRSPLRQAVIAVALQTAMVLLFVAAQPSLDAGGEMLAGPAGRWPLAVRVGLFACYSVWALVELFLALLPAARLAATGQLRWGVRLIQTAICVGVVWTLWSYDDIVHVLRYGDLNGSEDTVSNTLGAVCAAFVVAGSVVGKGSEGFDAAVRWLRLCRCYLVMGPLWSALRKAMPEIAFPEGGRPLLAGRPAGIEFALYRRVIEIHDGRLVLRAYHQPGVAAWITGAAAAASGGVAAAGDASGAAGPAGSAEAAKPAGPAGPVDAVGPAESAKSAKSNYATEIGDPAGLPGGADAALVEAAMIATALENMRHGRRFADSGAARNLGAEYAGFVPADLDAEVQWLSRVAYAFRRSPVIPEVLARLREEEG